MFRIKQLTLVTLAFTLILAACTVQPSASLLVPTVPFKIGDAEDAARSFLSGWVSNDYAKRYSLLSPKSLIISPEAFADVYKQVEDKLGLSESGKSYVILRDQAEQQGTTVAIHYMLYRNLPCPS